MRSIIRIPLFVAAVALGGAFAGHLGATMPAAPWAASPVSAESASCPPEERACSPIQPPAQCLPEDRRCAEPAPPPPTCTPADRRCPTS